MWGSERRSRLSVSHLAKHLGQECTTCSSVSFDVAFGALRTSSNCVHLHPLHFRTPEISAVATWQEKRKSMITKVLMELFREAESDQTGQTGHTTYYFYCCFQWFLNGLCLSRFWEGRCGQQRHRVTPRVRRTSAISRC